MSGPTLAHLFASDMSQQSNPTVDGRNPFRTTWKPWVSQENHPYRRTIMPGFLWREMDSVHPQGPFEAPKALEMLRTRGFSWGFLAMCLMASTWQAMLGMRHIEEPGDRRWSLCPFRACAILGLHF